MNQETKEPGQKPRESGSNTTPKPSGEGPETRKREDTPAPAGKPRKKRFEIKTLAAIGVGLFILILAVLVALDIEDISRKYIEKLASSTLGVPVHIGEISLEPKNQRITLTGLIVENPDGFSTPVALSIESLNIEIETIQNSTLVIRSIEAVAPTLFLEARNNQVNLTTIRQNMNSKAASNAEASPESPPVNVVIGKVDVLASNLYMTINGNDLEPLPLAPFRITGLGTERGPVLSSEAIARVMDQITRQVMARALEGEFLDYALTPNALGDLKSSLGLDYIGRAKSTIEGMRGKIEGLIGQQESR